MPDFGQVAAVLRDHVDAYVGRMGWEGRPAATLADKYGLLGRRLPADDVLASTLAVAYEATFTREEGRWTRFVLEVVDDVAPPSPTAPPDLVFAPSLELTAGAIRALGPAHDVNRNALLAALRPSPRLLGIRTYAGRSDEAGSAELTIEGLNPGELRIGWDGYRFLRIERDALTALAPEEWTVEEHVAPLTSTLLGAATADLSLTLGFLVRAIREQGHGGALWLLAEGAELPDDLTVGVPVEDPGPPSRLPRAARRSWAFSVGQMSAVDGAILLDAGGHLLGFGTFIHRRPDDWVLHVRPGSRVVERASVVGGGRHRAALAFCCSTAPSAAIVVSQDGPVSFFGHEEDAVARWGRSRPDSDVVMPFYGRVSDLGRVGVRRPV